MLHFTGSPDSLQSIHLAHFEEKTNLILLTGTDRIRTADSTAHTNLNGPS